MTPLPPSTCQKALQVSLDPVKYGTFTEIGAAPTDENMMIAQHTLRLLGIVAT